MVPDASRWSWRVGQVISSIPGRVDQLFEEGTRFVLGKGDCIRSWKDEQCYLAIFSLVVNKEAWVLALLLLTAGRDPGIIPRNVHPPEPEGFEGSTEVGGGQTPPLRLPRTKDVYVNGISVKVNILIALDPSVQWSGFSERWAQIFRGWHHYAVYLEVQAAERYGSLSNIVTYNVLLNGLCRKSSLHPETRFERTIQAAENLFEEMQRRGVEPDVTSYSIVLHVYSRAHKPDLSLWKLGLMKESGISPTVATYTSVIKCLCSCGRLEDAEKLLDEMVGNDVCPSAATYNCFFKEYRGRKDADSALKLYRKVRELLISEPSILSINSYNILVGMFSKLDRMEIVRELWNDMKESGVGPDLDSYTLLIHRLCDKQKWREACQFFVEMIEKGFLPQKTTFETLYKGLIQSDMLRTWRRLKNKLEEESLKFGVDFQQYHFKPYRR
ncbi:pentatricopeptide repeat-containing protein At2g13420, mitochondrial-like [Magnolia sinica]|uniref:pentatricopeptide repeat-containing protein At2g13420, mitochondrial-like n=1 Tax=Magnolia sinica TaxID=86752 RepID=UPI00265B70F9|nr:pentatricopeptide repeat-containing protein At2g13420, mitochondrial-like [Magnolia sinica]